MGNGNEAVLGCRVIFYFLPKLEDDFKRFPVGGSPKHVMDEETEVTKYMYQRTNF